jgi:hypothetical protein
LWTTKKISVDRKISAMTGEGHNGAAFFLFRVVLTEQALEFCAFEWGGGTIEPPLPQEEGQKAAWAVEAGDD